MTKTLERRHVFAVDEGTYWRELCLSLAYQKRLYCEALGCVDMEVLAHEGDYERGMTRRLRIYKPIDAPAAVTKIFGTTVTIEEHSHFDATRREWSYRMVPAVMSERIDIRGTIRLEPGPPSSPGGAPLVTQVSLNTVTCRLFGIGTIVEHFVAKSTEEGNEDKRRFTERYVAERGLR